MIRPYVEKDPSKFCTAEEFDAGVEALTEFVTLRGEAVSRQLAGDESAVETGDLNLSDMGSMGGGGGMPGGEGGPEGTPGEMPGGFTPPDGQSGKTPAPPDAQSAQGPAATGGPDSTASTVPARDSGDESSSGGELPTPSDNQGGQGPTPPDGQNSNEMPTGNGSGEWSAPSGKEDRGDRPQPPEGGSNFDPKGGPETGSAEATFWMLLGVSVLVLAGGIITAVKKKY